MNENDIMVDEDMNENVEETIEETTDSNGFGGLVALGVAAAGAGAFIVSRTKWGKAKIKEIRTNHAKKVLKKYAETDSDESEEPIKVDHVVVEDAQN